MRWLAFLVLLAFATPAKADTHISHTESFLVSSIPICNTVACKVSVISVCLEDIAVWETLSVHGSVGFTNPYDYNVGVGRYVTLAGKPEWTAQFSPAWLKQIPPQMTYNVTPENHHGSIDMAFDATGISGDWCINLVLYAASNSAWPGDRLTIDGNGFLQVTRW